MAAARPSGTAITIAPKVTSTDPRMRGRMPNCGGSEMGYQPRPKRKANGLISEKSESPSLSRNTKIRTTKTTEAIPEKKIAHSIIHSAHFFNLFLLQMNGDKIHF